MVLISYNYFKKTTFRTTSTSFYRLGLDFIFRDPVEVFDPPPREDVAARASELRARGNAKD